MIKAKKFTAFLLAALMVTSMCACGKTVETAPDDGSASMPNPITEVSDSDELCTATGIAIDAPEGASDVAYSYCINSDDSVAFAQVSFTCDGKSYCYRCAPSGDLTDITADPENGNLLDAISDCTNAGAALAGIYTEWKAGGSTVISERNGVYAVNSGKEGFVAWLDVVPGFLYSLSVDKGADQEALIEMAEKVFVPMQGEA